MNEIRERWRMESPEFFKNVSMIGKLLVGAGGILMASCLAAPEAISEAMLHYLKIASSYMVFGGGIMASIANLTVDDTDTLKKKINEEDKELD